MAKSLRLSAAVAAFVAVRSAIHSPTTARQDEIVCRRFVAALGDPLVERVTAESVEAWFHSLLAPHTTRDGRDREPIQASTFNYYYARIKSLVQFMTQRGMLRDDILRYVRPLKKQTTNRLRAGADALWEIIDSADNPRDRALLATAINTGLRASEISSLTVGDVDLETDSLKVRIHKSRLEDVMPLTSDLHAELVDWLDYYRAYVVRHHNRVMRESDFLFPARQGPVYGYRKAADGSNERFHRPPKLDPSKPAGKLHVVAKKALATVGLPTRGEGIHTLRRSAARAVFDSMVNENGYDGALRVTSTFLHHANGSTTEVYLGMDRERQVRDDHLRGRSLLGPRPGGASNVSVLRHRQ